MVSHGAVPRYKTGFNPLILVPQFSETTPLPILLFTYININHYTVSDIIHMRFHDRKKATRATPVGGVAPAVLKASSSNLQHAVGARSLPYSRSRIVSATRQLVHHVGSRLGGLLSRSFKKEPLEVARAEGHWYFREDGSMFYDASCGASVSHFGPGPHVRIIAAARAQEDKVSYVCGTSLTTRVAKEYADALLRTTDGVMKDAVFYGSGEPFAHGYHLRFSQDLGSDAIEAGYKLAIQYFAIIGQPNRRLFIARKQSYHGTTLTALSIGGHNARREDFKNVLVETHHVSPCNPYRDTKEEETNEMYVLRLQEELRQKFRDLGPENVAAFILEPIVGAVSSISFFVPWILCRPLEVGYWSVVK